MPERVGSLDEPGEPGKVVAQVHSNAIYAQGHLLYLRENTLMAQPFDLGRLETRGEAVPLAAEVPTVTQPARLAAFTVSVGGLLAYHSGAAYAHSQIVWKDRQGKVLGNLGEPRTFVGQLELSPDGERLVADYSDRSGNDDLWIYDIARGVPTRFTFDPAQDRTPIWSPDGGVIYFRSNRRGVNDLFRKASNGAGAEELLLGDSAGKTPISVSPDGTLLLYFSEEEKTESEIRVLPLTSAQPGKKREPRVFLRAPLVLSGSRFSPDGQWIAYVSAESGQAEVYATPFPVPGGEKQISSGGGTMPRWRRDGKELFYVTIDGQLMATEIAARNGTLEVGRVQKLFDGIVTSRGVTYDVSADGQKVLVVDDSDVSARPLTLVQNWTALLKK